MTPLLKQWENLDLSETKEMIYHLKDLSENVIFIETEMV